MPNFNGLWTSRQQMQARGGNTWPSVPGAPTSPVATAGNMSASVAFVAPSDTGYPAGAITGYRVTSSPGGFTGTGLTSPVTVTGLTNGTAYTFTVAAQNVNGYGPESVASNSVTPVLPNYVEEVFSTYLYTGNGGTQTITNGVDLAGKGGLVWVKERPAPSNHYLVDTVRGVGNNLKSNTTDAQQAIGLNSFTSTGFTTGSFLNDTGSPYVSWTFREQPKFFDCVTYTGDGGASQTINHNLGSAPGCMIVKRTDQVTNWEVYHRSLGATKFIWLNSTAGEQTSTARWNDTNPTSTQFTVGSSDNVNASGGTYVAYLFAHDSGGFGLTGTDNVISCGSYVGSSNTPQQITLGYEPQWVLLKKSSTTDSWRVFDNMRGMALSTGGNAILEPNTSSAESASSNWILPNATGFVAGSSATDSATYIYIAIRRGPMKVPTSGTSVFAPITSSASTGTVLTTNFPVDLQIASYRSAAENKYFMDRLRGVSTPGAAISTPILYSTTTDAEVTNGTATRSFDNTSFQMPSLFNGISSVFWSFGRAPGFFDEVCYTGNSTARTINHNLAAVPELMILKGRSSGTAGFSWGVYQKDLGASNELYLNTTDAVQGTSAFNDTAPTASVFSVGAGYTNFGGQTYVVYLFATCPGVSKVGTYTGTGSTQTIACGFAAGARFVLIKRTDSTGDWYVWDTVRGMVSGTDPSLLLNTTAAEVNANSVYTTTTGFQIVSTAAGINASGGTYIFLAIA